MSVGKNSLQRRIKGNEGQRQTLENSCVEQMVRERKANKENQGRILKVMS